MQVTIKVASADPGAVQGVELEIYDQERIHMGDLFLQGSQIVWCAGKTPHQLGKRVSWARFIEFLESE